MSLARADRILLITSGPRWRDNGAFADPASIAHSPGAPVSSALLTDSRHRPHFQSRLNGGPVSVSNGRAPGVGVIVGAALLADAGIGAATTAVEIGEPVQEVELILQEARDSADGVGLLVIGEGSASRGSDSPGGGNDQAEAFDQSLASALAAGDPAGLRAAVDAAASLAGALVWTSGPAFGELALLTADDRPEQAQLLYEGAPLGVGYFVATWSWSSDSLAARRLRSVALEERRWS
jgi:hypothetical protein